MNEICTTCDGTGSMNDDDPVEALGPDSSARCPDCDGEGYVADEAAS